MNALKVSDLSISEFKKLIKETMLETLESISIPEVDEEEQDGARSHVWQKARSGTFSF